MPELATVGDRFKTIGLDIRQHAVRENVTASAYTTTLFDDRAVKRFNSATAQTWTIPPRSQVPFDHMCVLTGIQVGAGTVTVVAGPGVTITPTFGASSLVSKGQYAFFQLFCIDDDQWLAVGGIG